MKKTILALFVLIPLVASCNKTDKGFVDPFPDDSYERIGFNIANDEKISRPLLSQETALVDETYSHLALYNPLITKVDGEIHERNYERAFAGEFKKGYTVSNKMYDDYFSTIRVGTRTSSDPKYECRQQTDSKTTTVVDYSYGRSTVESTTKSFHYLAEHRGDEKYYEIPSTSGNEQEAVVEQILEIYEEEESAAVIGASIKERPSEEAGPKWYSDEHFEIPMTGYIFPTAEATTIPGATKTDEVVLIKETHKPYGETGSGIYSLPDGRSYEAMVNSMIVTRLVKQPQSTNNENEWYLVNQVRQYSETAITSDVIQPNVPISYLTNPIIISFKEEIYRFSLIEQASTDTIDPVEID